MTPDDAIQPAPLRFFKPVISYVYEYEDGGPRAEMVETDHCNGLYYFRGDVDARLTAETRRREEAEKEPCATCGNGGVKAKCEHNAYWSTALGGCMACSRDAAIARAEKAIDERCRLMDEMSDVYPRLDQVGFVEGLKSLVAERDAAQREVERLREALEEIVMHTGLNIKDIARAALAVTPTTTTTETKKETP